MAEVPCVTSRAIGQYEALSDCKSQGGYIHYTFTTAKVQDQYPLSKLNPPLPKRLGASYLIAERL